MSGRVRFLRGRFVASGPRRASNLLAMRKTRRPGRLLRGAHAPVSFVLVGLALSFGLLGCSSGGSSDSASGPANSVSTGQTTDAAATPVASPTQGSIASSSPLPTVPGPVGQSLGCLTNGTLSGAFDIKVVDAVTRVNTQNVGENAPDAYYATSADKNTIAYFVFGKKSTVVVNGDGSWTGESGTDRRRWKRRCGQSHDRGFGCKRSTGEAPHGRSGDEVRREDPGTGSRASRQYRSEVHREDRRRVVDHAELISEGRT